MQPRSKTPSSHASPRPPEGCRCACRPPAQADRASGTVFDVAPTILLEPSAVDDAPSPGKPDLLIVDDDPLITDTLDFVLGRDFNVFVADSRAAVRSLLRQRETPPQLALIDLGLPP